MGNGSTSSKTVTRIINVPIVLKESNGRMAQSLIISGTQKLNVPDPYEQLSLNYTGIKNNFSAKKTDLSSSPEKGTSNEIRVVHGLVGLENLGNTCYFNTAIHCLSHTQPLLDYFMSRLYEKELNLKNLNGTRGDVTKSFAKLLLDIWKDTRCVGIIEEESKIKNDQYMQSPSKGMRQIEFVNPSELIQKIQKHSKRFELGYQEDGQELLSYLLDMIHEDVNRVKSTQKEVDLEFHDQYCNEQQAAQSWERHLKSNKSIIVDLFHGQMKSSLQCLECGSWSHKFEAFLFLSVPLQSQEVLEKSVSTKSVSESGKQPIFTQKLEDCLREFSQKEKLVGDSQWFCHKCKKNQDASKQIQLWKLPNVLIIHFKRFEFKSGSKLGKITTKVEFPIDELDLSEFVVSQQKEKPIYTLYAVAQHQGTLYNGHYTAVCRNRRDDKWYYYNDDQVLQVQIQ